MQYTTFGRTGLKVSRLGFGCMRLPMKNGKVDRDLSTPLLLRAVELGINYFDTAVGYCYGDSQSAIGDALGPIRHKVILSTKNHHYDKKDESGWWNNLEDSLQRLKADYIDIYNYHGLRWAAYQDAVAGPDGSLQWMLRAKEQGMIRHICFSFHDSMENLKKLADTGHFDAVTLQYNLLSRGLEPAFQTVAEKNKMAIVVMGPVGGGRLGGESEEIRGMIPGAKSVPEVAMRFVLSNPNVTIALSGMQNIEQLEENVRTISRIKGKTTAADKKRFASVLKKFEKLAELYCTGCNYCMPCPSGVNISGNFMALNYQRVYGLKTVAKNSYANLAAGQASKCLACGKCIPKCPQNIDIIGQLRETVRTLDDAYGHVVARVKPRKLTAFNEKRGWSAEIEGVVALNNISDDPKAIDITFSGNADATGSLSAEKLKLKEFGSRSPSFSVKLKKPAVPNRFDLGLQIEGADQVDIIGGTFIAAFAAPLKGGKIPARAQEAFIGLREQLREGSAAQLRKHGALVKFGYDRKGLRFVAEMQDDLASPAGSAVEHTDFFAICLDARPGARFGQGSYEEGVMRVNFYAPNKKGGTQVEVDWPQGADVKTMRPVFLRTEKGWRISAIIPWSMFTKDIPKKGSLLGMQLLMQSFDRKGNAQVRLAWSPGSRPNSPDQFGYLFLT